MGVEDVRAAESTLLRELNIIDATTGPAPDGLYEKEELTWSSDPKPRLFVFDTIVKTLTGLILATFLTLPVYGAAYLILSNWESRSPIAVFGIFILLASIGFMMLAVKLMLSPIHLQQSDKKTGLHKPATF